MKTIGKFKQADHTFIVKVQKTESKSNYNLFCHVFEEGSEQALTGKSFKDTDTKADIMKWASKSLGRPESEDFKRYVLGNKPKAAEEKYPELSAIAEILEGQIIDKINIDHSAVKTTCPYPAQCLLEMVIARLEKCV